MPSGFRKPWEFKYDLDGLNLAYYVQNKPVARSCRIEFSYAVFRTAEKADGTKTGDYVVVNLSKEECFKLAYQLLAFASELP